MAATNYTPIQLYHSTTASAVPVNTNLVDGELAININDGKLYYKDNSGTVQVIATKATGTIGGSTTQVQYNNAGSLAGSANFTFNGTTATINTLNLTNALGATYGGTAQSSWTAGDLLYASASNTLAKLGIGLSTYILTSNGTIPGWSAPSAISVSTATNLAGGAAGSVPYQSGAGATTFLAIGTAAQVIEVNSGATAPQWVATSGTGSVARVTSPSFTTPTLGVATATSINKVALTAPATAATLTIADGKTLTANASLTLAGTDATTMTFPATSTTVAGLSIAQTFSAAQTFSDAVTMSATTQNIALGTSQTSGTFTVGGAAQTGNITLDQSTKTHTLNVGSGATESGETKTINIGTGGVATSTTTITIGSANGTTTFNGTVNATTLDLTNLEVTNIKAKDGTAAMSIADSTGVVTFTKDEVVNGVTVGRGAGAVSTNTAVGASALQSNTTASSNTAVGYQSLYSYTSGSGGTVALGYQAGYSTNAAYGTFIGQTAGYSSTGANNTHVGFQAGYYTTTGTNNTSLGWSALQSGASGSTGASNTAIGSQALLSNTTASNNTAVGYQAGYSNTTGTANTFVGTLAGYKNSTGRDATHIGYGAGKDSTGGYNTIVGAFAGYALTTGTSNTFVGPSSTGVASAGGAMTTGSKNTILGGYNGNQNGLDIRTSSNNIVLSDGDGNPRWYIDNTGASGYGPSTGGTVTQATSRTTGVTLNKPTGAITLVSAAGTTSWQSFTVTNNTVAATDTVIVSQKSGTDLYQIFVTNVAAGSFQITFATTGGTTTEQPVFNFALIKGQTV